MAVRQRGASFQADFSIGGKRYRKDFDTNQEAEQWEQDVRNAAKRGEPTPVVSSANGDVRTMKELLFKTTERYWKGSKGEATAVKNAEDCLTVLGEGRNPSSISERHVDDLIAHFRGMKLSNSTINRKLAALSKLLHHGYKLGCVTRIPTIDRLKENENRIRWVTKEEEDKLLAHFLFTGKLSMRDLCILLIDSGLRLGEALRLEWKDTEGGWLRVWEAKNGKSRSVPQTTRVKAMLETRRLKVSKDEPVFSDLDKWSAEYAWRSARTAMNLLDDDQFVLHALRHTFCSRLVQRGVIIQTVKELAGHKAIQMTLRYAHLAPANLVDAMKVLDSAPALAVAG
jgi:integrase